MPKLLTLDGRSLSWPELHSLVESYWRTHDTEGNLLPVARVTVPVPVVSFKCGKGQWHVGCSGRARSTHTCDFVPCACPHHATASESQ